MGGKKTAGIILLVVGAVILLLSLISEVLGIGSSPGYGRQQIVGIIVGVIMGAVGVVLTVKK